MALVEFALFVSGSGGSLRSGCALYDIVRYVDGDVSALAKSYGMTEINNQ